MPWKPESGIHGITASPGAGVAEGIGQCSDISGISPSWDRNSTWSK